MFRKCSENVKTNLKKQKTYNTVEHVDTIENAEHVENVENSEHIEKVVTVETI